MASTVLAIAALGGAFCASSCGDDTSSTGSCDTEINGDGCFDTKACYKAGPQRSFKTDVLPIFERSCALSASCHGNPQSPTSVSGYQPYLGEVKPDTTPSDVDKILGLIVGQPSKAAKSMNIVEAGKADSSFMMFKLDDALMCSSLSCNFSECGTSMPQNSPVLPLEERSLIRDWINQGAQNN